jgi:hypothetical protein
MEPPFSVGVFPSAGFGEWRMQSDQRLLRGVIAQFLMGATMGAVLVGLIVLTDVSRIEAMIAGTAFPVTTLVIFCAGAMLYCAFGAAITGFLFLVSDGVPDERDPTY